jgi:hypothetical protein
MIIPVLLAADLIDILARGIPVILFVLWLIGQAISERQKQGKAAPRQAARPVAPQPKREKSEIEDEIDAFLRRASEKKGQKQEQRGRDETVILVPPKQEARRPQEVLPQRGERTRPAQTTIGRPRPQPAAAQQQAAAAPRPRPSVPRPAVVQENRPLRGPTIGSLRPLEDTGAYGSTSQLAAEISLADEKMQAHLESVFDHRLGTLQHREVAPTRRVTGSPIAESVVKMLRDPQGVQQLIVANEILRRPEF